MSERESPFADLQPLYGWEARTRYFPCGTYTRGQAKYEASYEEGVAFTDVRCTKVFLHYAEITEDDAMHIPGLPDWSPGDEGWIGCHSKADDAVAWWEVTWPRD